MEKLKELTNQILFEQFDFGIDELQISNLVFENLKYITEE